MQLLVTNLINSSPEDDVPPEAVTTVVKVMKVANVAKGSTALAAFTQRSCQFRER